MKLAACGHDVCTNLATVIRIVIIVATYIRVYYVSKLTPRKTFLLNTISQDRLSSLVMLSVETELLDKTDADKVTL